MPWSMPCQAWLKKLYLSYITNLSGKGKKKLLRIQRGWGLPSKNVFRIQRMEPPSPPPPPPPAIRAWLALNIIGHNDLQRLMRSTFPASNQKNSSKCKHECRKCQNRHLWNVSSTDHPVETHKKPPIFHNLLLNSHSPLQLRVNLWLHKANM